ncbi:MAG TPA: efflux transporter outer membrane subunit [Desulfobacterales bacterium]|nr:efflux transporter outer membrane subunit [Desulfobacterales bacterium]
MKIIFRQPLLGTAVIILLMAGCAAVGPNYSKPVMPVPAGWHTKLQDGLNSGQPRRLAHWWTVFHDPLLSRLIKQAAARNLNLKKARIRLLEARARRTMSRSAIFPALNTSGSITKNRANNRETNLYNAGFDAGWELDIFGGVRRSIEAATADLQADQEDLRDILVSLLAEVCQNYIDVRTYQVRLTVAAENIKTQQKSLQLVRSRYESGLVTNLDIQQAAYSLENSRAQVPSLRTGLNEAMNRLALLLGLPPGTLNKELRPKEPIPLPPPRVAVGIPANLIRRRPDIRRAERRLAAQAARVGVAAAALYPTLKLNGSIGFEALSLNHLFDTINRSSSFGPAISWPIFDAGRIRANIKAQSALRDQYFIQYESTVLTALNEVENALTAYTDEQIRAQHLKLSAAAAEKSLKLAAIRYTSGLTNFSAVLNAQESLLAVQDQAAQSAGALSVDLVRIYKALGGGWTSLTATRGTVARHKESTQ